MNPQQVRVLISDGELFDVPVDMPDNLGSWVEVSSERPMARAIREKRGRPRRADAVRWRFSLSEAGRIVAEDVRALVNAANASLAEYIESEHRASCFPGAFRDGFARGVHWAKNRGRTDHA